MEILGVTEEGRQGQENGSWASMLFNFFIKIIYLNTIVTFNVGFI